MLSHRHFNTRRWHKCTQKLNYNWDKLYEISYIWLDWHAQPKKVHKLQHRSRRVDAKVWHISLIITTHKADNNNLKIVFYLYKLAYLQAETMIKKN